MSTSRAIKVLTLTKYGRMGASSRMRMLQYIPWLQQAGVDATVQSLLSDAMVADLYQRGGYGLRALLFAYGARMRALMKRRKFDVLWIEKECLPWFPLWLELGLLRGVPYVLDYDDAVFHQYDMHRTPLVRRLFGQRLDGLMAGAALVVCGNDYLAQRARDAGASWVEVVPTVIDIDRYSPKACSLGANDHEKNDIHTAPCIVWIGSPSTARYLDILRQPLQQLARKTPFRLRVVGAGNIVIPGVLVESVEWSEDTEVESIRTADIGVMPLFDSPWEAGKCGYKLIQYMASGLPVVASHIGVNPEIVVDGINGVLVNSPDEWVDALTKLLTDPLLRSQLGNAGRVRVKRLYCTQQTGPRMVSLLEQASGRR